MILVRLAKEEEGVGISAGAHLARMKSAMLMQNHGFLASINGIVSCAQLYRIPLLMPFRGPRVREAAGGVAHAENPFGMPCSATANKRHGGRPGRKARVSAADVRVIELREDSRLAEEAGLRVGIEPALGTDSFKGDASLQRLVNAGVHLAHPTSSERPDDAVMRDDGAWQQDRQGHLSEAYLMWRVGKRVRAEVAVPPR